MQKILDIQLDDFAYEPSRAHPEDAGLDLRCPKNTAIHAGRSVVIDTGVHVGIENGWFGKLESKSGLNVNHGIFCSGGVIDAGYTGSIKVRLHNLSDEDYIMKAGDKCVQLVLIPCNTPLVKLVPVVSGGLRGDAGFGSTGR